MPSLKIVYLLKKSPTKGCYLFLEISRILMKETQKFSKTGKIGKLESIRKFTSVSYWLVSVSLRFLYAYRGWLKKK